jgi:hypothetical protein
MKTARAALEKGPIYILYPSEPNAGMNREYGLSLVPVEGDTLYELCRGIGAAPLKGTT